MTSKHATPLPPLDSWCEWPRTAHRCAWLGDKTSPGQALGGEIRGLVGGQSDRITVLVRAQCQLRVPCSENGNKTR